MEYVAKLKGVLRTTLDNSKWRMFVAKLMLNWKDPMVECETTISSPVDTDNHCPKPISKSAYECVQCVVCSLETSIQNSLGIQIVDACDQSQIVI